MTPEKKNRIEGVWELVSTKPLLPDGSFESCIGEWSMLKVVTATHFMFVEQAPHRPRFIEGGTDAELLAAAKTFFGGCGTYTFDGTIYTEYIKIFLNPNYIGTSVTYTCEFKDKLWIQQGTFPMKSVGLKEDDYELTEIWRRVE